MAVGADKRIRIGDRFAVFFLGPNRLGEIFEIHLVADTGPRRHGAEVIESRLAPAQELITLLVALIFQFHIQLERVLGAEIVDHHRVVDDQIDRHERVDLFRVATELDRRVAHGRKIDDCGNAGKILHEHARGPVGDLVRGFSFLQPLGAGNNVFLGNGAAIFEAQQVLKNDFQGKRQLGHTFQAVFLRFRDGEIGVGLVTDLKRRFALETVKGLGHGTCSPSLSAAAGPRLTAAFHDLRRLPMGTVFARFELVAAHLRSTGGLCRRMRAASLPLYKTFAPITSKCACLRLE